jgi:hypothetical protein
VGGELLGVATQLLAAREAFATSNFVLPCTLWTISAGSSNRPTFVGLMPNRAAQMPVEPGDRGLLQRELAPHLRELRQVRVDYAAVVQRVLSLAQFAPSNSVAHWLAELVLAT